MKKPLRVLALISFALILGAWFYSRNNAAVAVPVAPVIGLTATETTFPESAPAASTERITTKPFMDTPEELHATLITGRCVDNQGQPLVNTEIQLVTLPKDDENGNPGIISYGKTRSSSDGTFVVGPIKLEEERKEDTFSLIFRHRSPDHSQLRLHFEPHVHVRIDQTTNLGDVVVGRPSEAATLNGRLETDQGEPLPQVDVRVYYRANIPPHTLSTNEQGRFQVIGLAIPSSVSPMFMAQVQPLSAQRAVNQLCTRANAAPKEIVSISALDDRFNIPNEHNFEGRPGSVDDATFVAKLREPPTIVDGIYIASNPEFREAKWRLLAADLQVLFMGNSPLSDEITEFVFQSALSDLQSKQPLTIEFENSDGERFARLPVTVTHDTGVAKLHCAPQGVIPWQRGTTLSGVAITADGNPVSGAELVLDIVPSGNAGFSYRTVTSAADGTFEVKNIAPRTYRSAILGPEGRNRWIMNDQPTRQTVVPAGGINIGRVEVY